MKIENYKAAMRSVKTDASKYKELSKLIDSDEADVGNKPKDCRKRIHLPTILAATLIIATVGVITVAAAGNGLLRLKQYFDSVQNSYDWSNTDVPLIENAGIYGSEINSSDSSGEVDIQITSAACDGHHLIAMIEVDITGSAFLDDVPAGTVPQFRLHTDSCGSGNYRMELASHEGNVYSYVFIHTAIKDMPKDEIVITLAEFGYYPTRKWGYNDFVTLSDLKFELEIPTNKLNIMQSAKAATPMEIMGVDFEAELSSFGLLMYCDYGKLKELGLYDDKYFLDLKCFEIFMKDGRIFGDGENYESVYGFLCSENGWVDFETGTFYRYFGFAVPVDISEIEAVSAHGVRFEFDSEDEE